MPPMPSRTYRNMDRGSVTQRRLLLIVQILPDDACQGMERSAISHPSRNAFCLHSTRLEKGNLMQPAFSRSRSHGQNGPGYVAVLNDGPQTTGEQGGPAFELSRPCPSCPDNIGHQVFQDFIEQGKVPDDLADVVNLGIWCARNGERKALAHLFEHGFISTASFKLGRWSDAELGVVIDALRTTVCLTRLSLAGVKLSSAILVKLCDALQSGIRLTSLDLGYNHLGEEAVAALSSMLAANTSLTELELSTCDLDGASGVMLGHALSTNNTLTALNLFCNSLATGGAQEILLALETNKALLSLDLRGNQIDCTIAETIGHLLKQNSTLTALDLSGNKIGMTDKFRRSRTIEHIVDGFQCNAVLMHLVLINNNLDQFIEPSIPYLLGGRLEDLQQRNRTLSSLSRQDSAMFAQPSLPVALPQEVGQLLSRYLILASKSTEHYEDIIVDVHAALNACAREAEAERARQNTARRHRLHGTLDWHAASFPDSSSSAYAPGLPYAQIPAPSVQQQGTAGNPSAAQNATSATSTPVPDCCSLV